MPFTRVATGLALVLAVAVLPIPAGAKQSDTMPTIYDRPVQATKGTLKPGLVDDGGGLTCFDYGQFVVKEVDSGTPDGDLSLTVVPRSGGPGHPCSIAPETGQVAIKPQRMSFVGVKGDFVVMGLTDPNGSIPFVVYDRRTGAPRYTDSFDGIEPRSGLQFIADEAGTLHLKFKRGLNTSCSIAQDGTACWSKIVREFHLPPAVSSQPPSQPICKTIYGAQGTPFSDPSIITYDVDLLVPATGPVNVISRGMVSCTPMP